MPKHAEEKIRWEDDVVLFADKRQWKNNPYHKDGLFWESRWNSEHYIKCEQISLENVIKFEDFQLNEIKVGDLLNASAIRDEEDYDKAITAFGTFGFKWEVQIGFKDFSRYSHEAISVSQDGTLKLISFDRAERCRRVSLSQLIKISEVKLAMNTCYKGVCADLYQKFRELETAIENEDHIGIASVSGEILEAGTMNYSAGAHSKVDIQSVTAFRVLEGMGIHYDEGRGEWYKKVYL